MKNLMITFIAIFGFATITSAQLPNYVPSNGLVGYWSFNGNANDDSNNGNNGTLNGSVSLSTDRFGNINSSYSFPGISDSYIDCGNSATLQIVGALTISGWFYMEGGTINPRILNFESGSSLGGYTVFVDGTSNTNRIIHATNFNDGGVGTGFCCSSSQGFTITALAWHHFVYTADINGLAKMYIDGANVGTYQGVPVTNITYASSLIIGRKTFSDFDAWGGKLDDIGIWNRVLTQQEINGLYTSSCINTDITTGLVASYPFSGNANDASGNNINGTTNNVTLTTDRFGNANSAYQFNGVNSTISVADNPLLKFQSANKISFSLWLKADTIIQNFNTIILAKQSNGGINQVGFNFASDVGSSPSASINNVFRVKNGSSNAFGGSYDTTINFRDKSWHHVVCVYTGTVGYIYIDNVLRRTSINQTGVIGDNTSNLLFGAPTWTAANTKYFKGKLDDIKFYNISLNACDVDSLFNLPNSCTGVTASITPQSATTFCQGDSVILTASLGASYAWSNSQNTRSITVKQNGTYTVTVTNGNGCIATSASTTVTVNAKPTVSPTASPQTICNGNSTTLAANATAGSGSISTYAWSSGIAGNSSGGSVSPTSTTTYTVTVTNSNNCSASASTTVTVNAPNITTGLVASYPFTGNANDISGNNLNGTTNNVTLTTDRFGNTNSAYQFNGSNSSINVLDNALLKFASSNKIAISLWLKLDTLITNTNSVMLSKQINSGTNQVGFNIDLEQFGTSTSPVINVLRVRNGSSNNFGGCYDSIVNVKDKNWHHVVYDYSGTVGKIYVDNILRRTSINQTGVIGDNLANLTFGTPAWSPSSYFKGKLDDIRIYNISLNACDVDSLFNLPNTLATGLINRNNVNSIKVYPNPTSNQIIIDNGNFVSLIGYTIKITNSIGQQVFQSLVTQQQFTVDLSSFGGAGLYHIVLINPQGVVVDNKKLVLQ
jgi:hypothetical protein